MTVPPREIAPPPRADRRPSVRTVHGRELVDDYGWLSERGAEDALAYLEAENRYADSALAHLEDLRHELYREFVDRVRETDLTVPVRLNDRFYYSRTEKGLQYPIYCRKQGHLEADEEVLLDLNELALEREYLRLGGVEVSPDHRFLAFCLDTSGSESFELLVRDLESGKLLDDRFRGVAGSIAWAADSRTLLFIRLDSTKRPYKVMRHRLGDEWPPSEVYREDDGAFFVSVEQSRSREYLFIRAASNVTSEVLYLPAERPDAEPRAVEPRRHDVEYSVDHRGGHFYLRTNRGARNFRLVRRSIGGGPGEDVEILPARDDVTLERVEVFERHLVAWERREGTPILQIIELDGEAPGPARSVELPESVHTISRQANPEFGTSAFRFGYTSMVTPSTVYECDLDTLELEVLKVQEVLGGYDASAYVTGRLLADSGGVRVPVTYVHRSAIQLNGRNPCLLHAYGAYGSVIEPTFAPLLISLLDRGFVFAVAHVRGGGYLGESWHEEGRMASKQTSFDDFVAAAEHLVEAGYTSPGLLAARGGSAGGLLIGAVLNARPELFRAAIARVPFVDIVNTMLDPTLPLTVTEYEEWGNPEDPELFEVMLGYSPYDNVGAREYPAMLVTAGLNDPRVQYWEPAKWVAKIRAMKTDDNPLVLCTDMGAGHGGPSGRYEVWEKRAHEYAFLLDALGLAGSGP